MHLTDIHWWLIIVLNFIGYLLFSFGLKISKREILRNYLAEIIEFTGGIVVFTSFALIFWFFGTISGLMLILIFWFVIIPIVRILIKI